MKNVGLKCVFAKLWLSFIFNKGQKSCFLLKNYISYFLTLKLKYIKSQFLNDVQIRKYRNVTLKVCVEFKCLSIFLLPVFIS